MLQVCRVGSGLCKKCCFPPTHYTVSEQCHMYGVSIPVCVSVWGDMYV